MFWRYHSRRKLVKKQHSKNESEIGRLYQRCRAIFISYYQLSKNWNRWPDILWNCREGYTFWQQVSFYRDFTWFLMTCSEQRFIHFLYTMCNVDQHRNNFVSNNRLIALYPFCKLSEYAFFGWILRFRRWNNIRPLSFLMCFKIMPVMISFGQHQCYTSHDMTNTTMVWQSRRYPNVFRCQ